MQKSLRYWKLKIEVLIFTVATAFLTAFFTLKVKHPSSDINRKNISLMKIINIILELRTPIILLSSFVIYFFCVFHLGSFLYMFSYIFCFEYEYE